MPSTRSQLASAARPGSERTRRRAGSGAGTSAASPSAAASASRLRSMPSAAAAELGVVPASETGGELDDAGAVRAEHDLRVRRAFAIPSASAARSAACAASRGVGSRPRVRERHAERGRLGRQAVGHGERMETARRPRTR